MSTIRILLDKLVYTEPTNGMVWMENGVTKYRARLQEKRTVSYGLGEKTEWADIDVVYLEPVSAGVDANKEGKEFIKDSSAEAITQQDEGTL